MSMTVTVACNKPAAPPSDSNAHDSRTAVALPADGQQAVLLEMRHMLGALGGAASAAAREDTTALFAAIAPAGSAAAADPALEALLPTAWKEIAERTHSGFDSLAMAVRRTPRGAALRDTVLVRVAQLTAQCNACHETFRVTVKPE
ncbi:MAG: hypothetical protein H3C62_03820 [Gemmatimonadaceae bacterium]|nr:hypothetical protein [Gemmatimonadaceae bacterium]